MQEEPGGERICLTVEEAARLLGIGRSLAYEAVARGELPSTRIGRRILIPKLSLERLLSHPKKAEAPDHPVQDEESV